MKKLASLNLAFALLLTACDSDVLSKIKNALDDQDQAGAVIKTSVTLAASKASLAPPLGHVSATGLHSLKYYITSMGICQTANVQGTGFSMGPNCIELYTAPKDDKYQVDQSSGQGIPTFEQYKAFADAARADTDNPNFIDLMDADSRATMARSVTLTTAHVGDYQYGYIYWYYPLKIKADITLQDGTPLHTHDGAIKHRVDQNNYDYIYTESPSSFTEGVAEEAVFVQQNGGNWFRFQTPFAITEADITSATEFKLELAFNPEGVIKGAGPGMASGGSLIDRDIDDAGKNEFVVPLLDLAPVVHRADERALRESYVFDISAPTSGNRFQIRYDLYYAEPRPDTILAVETKTLVTPQTTDRMAYGWSISGIDTAADGKLTLKMWDGSSVISNFVRGKAQGDAATATFHCMAGNMDPQFSWCDGTNMNELTGTLVGIFPVSE